MILVTVNNRKQIESLDAYGYILSLESFSSLLNNHFSLDEIKKILDQTSKNIYLKLDLLYHDKEIDDLKNVLKSIGKIKGIFFQDFAIANIVKELNLNVELFYDPLTFNTTSIDQYFFSNTLVTSLVLSQTLSLKEIDELLSKDIVIDYAFKAFGYLELFRSEREHLKNYSTKYSISLSEEKYTIREENRDINFIVKENDRGFYVYSEKKLNAYHFLYHLKKIKYLVLDSGFINDNEFEDTINLFKNEMSLDEYSLKYGSNFNTEFLFKEIVKRKDEL